MSHPSDSTGPTRTTGSSTRSTPLFRGTGCHHCRTRKVKCDAGKPFCARCIQQETTDRCKYDEVKKSKLTLAKEEIAGLKARLAEAERRLAGKSPPAAAPPALEDIKEPPSSTFSQLALEEEEEDYGYGQGEDVRDDPINFGPGPYPVQPRQQFAHGTRPEHYATGPVQLPRLDHCSQFQHVSQSGSFERQAATHSGHHHLPVDPYQQAYQAHPYSYAPSENAFHGAGFAQGSSHAQSVPYAPQAHTGSLSDGDTTWPVTPIDLVPDASTSGFTSSPLSRQWRQLPYLDPDTTPGSHPSNPSTNYPRGAWFRDDGRYIGGPMHSYDAYQGAPNRALAGRRPVPSPPVYGHDVVMEFFQQWKTQVHPQAHIEDKYAQAPTSSSWELVGNWWERDDLPEAYRNFLLEIVLPYRKQMGLEIWVPEFLASLHMRPQLRPHPCFMWMLYSFAAFFSGDPELQALLPEFLERARRNLEESFANSDRLFDYIRGQTLYASIKYMSGMVREGSLATTAACHAATMCGLHKISSAVMEPRTQYQERTMYRINQVRFQLEPATSAREHGERIAAFWQLILVDHSAAATTGVPAIFRDDGDERYRVETVFPRPIEEYINGRAGEVPYATLGDVFTSKQIPNPPDIIITLQVKATALLERAVRLSTKWDQGKHVSTTDPVKYHQEYNYISQAIHHFKSYLPSMYAQEENDPESKLALTSGGLIYERLFPHFMVWTAEIHLFNMLEEEQIVAREMCLRSAREIRHLTALLTDGEIEVLGVLLGHCFRTAHHVFLRELSRYRDRPDEAAVRALNQDLNVLSHALEVLAANHHLVAVQSEGANRSRIQEFPV